jgi:hypothetical protein
LWPIFIHFDPFYPLWPIFIHFDLFYPLWPIFIHFDLFLSILTYFYLFWPIFIHCDLPMDLCCSYYYPFWATLANFKQKYTSRWMIIGQNFELKYTVSLSATIFGFFPLASYSTLCLGNQISECSVTGIISYSVPVLRAETISRGQYLISRFCHLKSLPGIRTKLPIFRRF